MSFGTFNNPIYGQLPQGPPLDPPLEDDRRWEYERSLYMTEARRSPSPGPSRPYPAYDRYAPTRSGHVYRSDNPDTYRPDRYRPDVYRPDAWRLERPYRPATDHYEPAYEDDWNRQGDWEPAYAAPPAAARPSSPPAAWPRGRRDSNTMAARMFEPSEAWKQTQGQEFEQDLPQDRYPDPRDREYRPVYAERDRPDYTHYPMFGDSYRPHSPTLPARGTYRSRQLDSYRPAYDNDWSTHYSADAQSNSGSLPKRENTRRLRRPRARKAASKSRNASYDRSLSRSPSSSRSSSSRASPRRYRGRSTSSASSRGRSRASSRGQQRNRSRSYSRSSIASSVNEAVGSRRLESRLPNKTTLSVHTSGLDPYSYDRSSSSPTWRRGSASASKLDSPLPHPSLPQRPYNQSTLPPNGYTRTWQDGPPESYVARDIGVQNEQPRRRKKRRGGVGRRNRLNAQNHNVYPPFVPPSASAVPLRQWGVPSQRLEPKIEPPELDLQITRVPDAREPSVESQIDAMDLVVEAIEPPVEIQETPFDASISTVGSHPEYTTTTVPVDFVTEPLVPAIGDGVNISTPRTSEAIPDSSMEITPAAVDSDELRVSLVTNPPIGALLSSLSQLFEATQETILSEPPCVPIPAEDHLPKMAESGPLRGSSPSSAARSPSLHTPSPPHAPSVVVAVEGHGEPTSSSTLLHMPSKEMAPPTVDRTIIEPLSVHAHQADSLQDALKVVISARRQYDLQTREERINPVLSANNALATSEAPTSASCQALLDDVMEGARSQPRMDVASTVRPSLVKYVTARQETVSEKVTRLRQEYLDLHHKWVEMCAMLDNSNQPSASEEIAAVSGRTTRRSAAVLGDAVRSDLEMEQIIASLGNEELYDPAHLAIRNVAIIPDMISVTRGKVDYVLDDTNNLVDDPASFYDIGAGMAAWTDAEKEIFKDKYAAHPKQFGIIAESLPHKTQAQCVLFYYLNKKTLINFRQVVAAYGQGKKRRGGRRMDKKKGGLLADIRQHDAEVSKTAPARRPVGAPPGPRRKRTAATGEPVRRASRRSTVHGPPVDPSPMTTPTPEPDGRTKRRRGPNASKQADQEDADPDATDVELPPAKRTRRGRKPKPSVTEFETPPDTSSDPRPADTGDLASKRRPSAAGVVTWSDEDHALFLRLLAQYGDDFKRIAASMPNKTTIQVSSYYKSNLDELDLARVAAQAPKRSPTPEAAKDVGTEPSLFPGTGVIDVSTLTDSPEDPFVVHAAMDGQRMDLSSGPVASRNQRQRFSDYLPTVSGWPGTSLISQSHPNVLPLPTDSRTIYNPFVQRPMGSLEPQAPSTRYPTHYPHQSSLSSDAASHLSPPFLNPLAQPRTESPMTGLHLPVTAAWLDRNAANSSYPKA